MNFHVGKSTANWAELTGLPCKYFDSADSTNNQAKLIKLNPQAAMELFIADQQTAGRGRNNSKWESPEVGSFLLTSWTFELNKSPQPILAPLIGQAIYKALSATWPWLDFSLKAPNDILLEGQKVAGILIENIQEGSRNRLIVGLGLNVFSQPNLPQATYLHHALGESLTEVEFHQLLDRILLELSICSTHFQSELTRAQRLGLLFSLNKNPNINPKYLSIESNGDLITPQSKIAWESL